MTNRDYWEKRTLARIDGVEKIGLESIKQVLPLYEQALQNIKKDIDRIFVNYSEKVGLDVMELTKVLGGADKENFLQNIQGRMRSLGFNVSDIYDERYIGRLTRLEALKQQIYWQVQEIAPKEIAITEENYKRVIKQAYQVSSKDIREYLVEFEGYRTGDFGAFATLDDSSMYQILRQNWQGGSYYSRTWTNNAMLNNKIQEILPRVVGGGLLSGISEEKMQRQIREFFDVSKYYATRLIRTETNYFLNQAELQSYEDEGIEYYEYISIMDNRTSDICERLNGEVFKVEDAQVGLNYPPMHPNSYHKDTEVYTERGFVLVKDVKLGEKVLSLNPETRDLEWTKVVKTYKHKEPKLYSYQSRNLDLVVTPDHDLLIQKRWNKRTGGRRLEMVKAKDLPPEASFYRSSKWKGSVGEIETYGMPLGIFCQFMGWYLAEGSVATNRGDIKISQEKPKTTRMINEMLGLSGLDFTQIKGGFLIRSKELREYLGKFGKCFEKYVPEEIKQLPPEYIRMFLDAYNLGDGSIRNNNWKGGNFSPERSYFTTSKRMADDLGELLIKVGKRPSYFLRKDKGKQVKHKNGIYTGNWDLWIIRECNSQFASVFERKVVDYNDYVYCVELEKNHTLYVRKNGKCVWSGNCRSDTILIWKEESKKRKVWEKEEWEEHMEEIEEEKRREKEKKKRDKEGDMMKEIYETQMKGLESEGWKRR